MLEIFSQKNVFLAIDRASFGLVSFKNTVHFSGEKYRLQNTTAPGSEKKSFYLNLSYAKFPLNCSMIVWLLRNQG